MQVVDGKRVGAIDQPVSGYRVAFICVTSLFFLWGLAYGLLDVLNKHFQEALHVDKADSTWLQAAYFGAYFIISWPAAAFMNRRGYKAGILLGLGLYALGAFLFIPAAKLGSFPFFVGALFVLASGITCLETAANPYVTILGPPDGAERRLNLSQCFNGLGSVIGPAVGGALFLAVAGHQTTEHADLSAVRWTYAGIGALVLLVAAIISRVPLPDARSTDEGSSDDASRRSLWSQGHFLWGVVAQFFYVAAQVGVGALFINLVTEQWHGLSSENGAYLLSVGMILFLAGRFITTALMTRIAPRTVLTVYAAINVVLTAVVAAGWQHVSVAALLGVFFFMSIMFPTIFSLGIRDLGERTKVASSAMVASVVGGAILPVLMGRIAQSYGTPTSYLMCTVCFGVVALYGWRGATIRHAKVPA